jgi:uncharacterized protein YjbI with pentapeptide repeats
MCEFKPHEKFDDLDYQCRHPARQDGLCIFHLLKPTEEQKQAMTQEARMAAEAIKREFHQAFSKLLEDEEKNPEVEVCDFSYFRFPSIDLSGRRFAKPLRLRGTTFSGVAGFKRATFSGEANFQRATFSGEAYFWGVTFSRVSSLEVARFEFATFSGEAYFQGATFSEQAYFQGATFSGEAYFQGATFSGAAYFSGAEFWHITFGGEAHFWGATFSGAASFRGETFKGECRFVEVTLDEKARVVFDRANLRQASFLGTNLERIHFRDVEWPSKGRRQVLWDEFPHDEFPHEEGQPDYEKVAENYRQLVLNYEAKRDFDTAEEFHIGEMEMRRKKKGKKAEYKAVEAKSRGMKLLWRCWGVINGYSIYKFLSNYGTSYLRGFLVLLVWLVLFSGIFLYTGLKPSKEHKDSLHDINYELCLHTPCQRASWQQKVSDSAKTLVFTLSLLTFQKDRLYEPATACTQFWICIAVPLLAGQTALVLFAIRRRFKR